MKRVNKEHIVDVVDKYFKKRNFNMLTTVERTQSTDVASSAVNMAASLEASALGAINCAAIADSNSTDAEAQFSRLVLFVKEANEKHKSALMNILFPIFISIYIDMLVGGLKQMAYRFHQTNRPIFNNLPIYKSTIDAIMMVVQRCDKDNELSLSQMLHAELGENKFNVKFSAATLNYLKRYLTSRDNSVILQVFNSNVTVETDAEDSVLETICASAPTDPSAGNERAMKQLKSAIDDLNSTLPSLPDLNLHLLSPSHPRVICGHVTEKHLIAGCSDSSLQLLHRYCQLVQRAKPHCCASPQGQGKFDVDVSRVYLSGDWLDDSIECSTSNGDYEPHTQLALRGHSSDVCDVKGFSDSHYVISCSADRTIRLWDTNSCTNRVIYRGHLQTIWSLDTARHSSYFVSCSKDRSAKLWSTEFVFPLRSYIGHISSVDCVKFHPNNSYLATASQDRTVRLWDVQSGKCVRLMQGHRGSILSLSFSPSGTLLASAGEDRRIRLWDLASGDLVKELKGHTDSIRCLEFNSDGSLLYSGSQDNTIHAWNVKMASGTSSLGSMGSPTTSSDLLATYSSRSPGCSFINVQYLSGALQVIGVT